MLSHIYFKQYLMIKYKKALPIFIIYIYVQKTLFMLDTINPV